MAHADARTASRGASLSPGVGVGDRVIAVDHSQNPPDNGGHRTRTARHSADARPLLCAVWMIAITWARGCPDRWPEAARLARSPTFRRRSLHGTTSRHSAWRREPRSHAIGRSGIVGSV